MKKILTNNLRLKLIAFVIALGLWLYVYTEHHQRYFVTFPVKITYTKLNFKLALEDGPKSIYVRFKGNPKDIENIDQRKLWAEADMSDLKSGPGNVKLKLHNTASTQVFKTNLNIHVVLRNKDSAQHPLDISMHGKPPAGKTPGAPFARTNVVTFYGNQKDVERIVKAVVHIYLNNRTRNFTVAARVGAVDDYGKPVKGVIADPVELRISVPIFDAVSRSKPVQLVFHGKLSDSNTKILPSVEPQTVTLFGDEKILDRLKTAQTEEFDAQRCQRGETFFVKIETPSNVTASPSGVTVSCKLPSAQATRTLTVRLESLNLAPDLKANLDPESIDVTITGDAEFINQLTADRISARVDVLGRAQGTHLIVPEVFVREVGEGDVSIKFDRKAVRASIEKE